MSQRLSTADPRGPARPSPPPAGPPVPAAGPPGAAADPPVAAAGPPAGTAGRRRVRAIHRRLLRRYGELEPPRRTDPLEELVFTVLSQNTSDANSSRAYASLRERFPSWEELAAARPEEVAEAIRVGGLARIKAPRILAILGEVRRREGRLDLSWMRRATDEEVRAYLSSLPGVGPKTVAVVLAFSLRRAAIPVDTHVHRVSRRLGLVPPRASAEAAHRILEELVPPELRVELHVGLIRLGREVCVARRPRCEACPLADLCPTAPRYLAEAAGRGGLARGPGARPARGPGPGPTAATPLGTTRRRGSPRRPSSESG